MRSALRAITVVLLGLAGAIAAAAPDAPAASQHPRRQVLPDSVVPLHYELALAPDAEALTFTARVAITIEVVAATPTVTQTQRWRVAAAVAAGSSDPQRIADLEAYEARSVPPESSKPFLAAVAAIRRNQRIAARVLPEVNRWIAAANR